MTKNAPFMLHNVCIYVGQVVGAKLYLCIHDV
jgi:hypothetical protein